MIEKNLPHHQTTTSKEVPLPCGHQLECSLNVVNSAARPAQVGQGAVRWTLRRKLLLSTKGKIE